MSVRRPRRPLLRAIGWGLLAAGLGLAALQAWYLARVVRLVDHDPDTTAFIELRRAEGRAIHRDWVPYERMSQWLKRAVVAAEDARFVEHGGFDWTALREAFAENLKADRVVRGGSTISQQLAKNLSPSRSLPRKAQEAAITVMLESVLTKRRILELYLNLIEWGDGVFGAEAAARH